MKSINQSKTKESKSRNGGKPTRDGTEWESKKKEERERERNKKRSNEKREKGRTAKKKENSHARRRTDGRDGIAPNGNIIDSQNRKTEKKRERERERPIDD